MKKIILTICLAFTCLVFIQAQENTVKAKSDKQEKTVYISVKYDGGIIVFIDGKKYDPSILELLDRDKIESIDILKGKEALEKYNSPNVILIKSKLLTSSENIVDSKNSNTSNLDTIQVSASKIIISNSNSKNNSDSPIIIVNREIKDKKFLKQLSPDDIERIDILKDEKSKKKYNTEKGVIIITTKEATKEKEKGKGKDKQKEKEKKK